MAVEAARIDPLFPGGECDVPACFCRGRAGAAGDGTVVDGTPAGGPGCPGPPGGVRRVDFRGPRTGPGGDDPGGRARHLSGGASGRPARHHPEGTGAGGQPARAGRGQPHGGRGHRHGGRVYHERFSRAELPGQRRDHPGGRGGPHQRPHGSQYRSLRGLHPPVAGHSNRPLHRHRNP